MNSLLLHGLWESRWRYPHSSTNLVELRPECVQSAIDQIVELRDNHQLNALEKVHFVRIVVLEASNDLHGNPIPAQLLINAVFDYSPAEFFTDFADSLGGRLTRLLKYCSTFKEAHECNVAAWMLQTASRPETLHIGTLFDDVAEIRQESRLQVAVEHFMDRQQTAGAWDSCDATKIHTDVLEFVRKQPGLPQDIRRARTWNSRIFQTVDLLTDLSVVVVPPLLIAAVIVWLLGMSWWSWWWISLVILVIGVGVSALVIRWYEITESDLVVIPKPGQTRDLVEDEDFGVQNQISLVIPVRDSRFRRLTIKIVLWAANSISKHWYQRGALAGIDTIHFARFHLIDGGKRMVFISDFDGGWERYLFDFVGVGSLAVVPIWSNLHGCPKARLLRFPVAGFAQRFLPFTRSRQIRTQFNYSAISYLTVAEIKRNAEIRNGLFRARSQSQIQRLLDLF